MTTTFPSLHANAQAEYNPTPSLEKPAATKVAIAQAIPKNADSVGIPVAADGDVPKELGLDRAALNAAGFEGKVGQTLVVPRAGADADRGRRRQEERARHDQAARRRRRLRARARKHAHLAVLLADANGIPAAEAAQAIVEGALLARYRYLTLKHRPEQEPSLRSSRWCPPRPRRRT